MKESRCRKRGRHEIGAATVGGACHVHGRFGKRGPVAGVGVIDLERYVALYGSVCAWIMCLGTSQKDTKARGRCF